jgi:hypothetical protein
MCRVKHRELMLVRRFAAASDFSAATFSPKLGFSLLFILLRNHFPISSRRNSIGSDMLLVACLDSERIKCLFVGSFDCPFDASQDGQGQRRLLELTILKSRMP